MITFVQNIGVMALEVTLAAVWLAAVFLMKTPTDHWNEGRVESFKDHMLPLLGLLPFMTAIV